MPAAVSSGSGSHTTARQIYPYSVIPGGVRNAGELKRVAVRDPVVAEHYADFKLNRARVVRLKAQQTAYVSYRLNGQIYWTREKIRLIPGETLLSDGKNYARTRCGNRISQNPQPKTTQLEPRRELLESPRYDPVGEPAAPGPITMALASETMRSFPLPPAEGVPTEGIGIILGGGYGVGSAGTGTPQVIPPPIAPVPEPASLILLTSGLAGIWAVRKKLQK